MSNLSDVAAVSYHGILCRGVLLGYAKFPEQYRNKAGEIVNKDVHALGVEKTIKGRFGEIRQVTQQLLLPEVLMKNREFMNSISVNMGKVVEIPLSGYSDFNNRPYISNDAELFPVD